MHRRFSRAPKKYTALDNVSRSQYVANQLSESFWTSSLYPDTVFGIRLYNSAPITNSDYPFQLLLTYYTPGFGFYADTNQDRGGIATNGTIVLQYDTLNGWKGKMTDNNTIEWEGSMANRSSLQPGQSAVGKLNQKIVWKRTYPPANTMSDQFSGPNILAQASQLTDRYNAQYHLAYPAIYKNIQL